MRPPPLTLPSPCLRLAFAWPSPSPRLGLALAFAFASPSSFLPQLDPQGPPKTTPFGDSNRPKIVPRRVLRAYLVKNVTFREMQFRLGETPLCDPKTAQDEAKIGPRSPQDGLKTDQKSYRF